MVQRHNDHHHSAHQVNGRDAGFLDKEFGRAGHVAKLWLTTQTVMRRREISFCSMAIIAT